MKGKRLFSAKRAAAVVLAVVIAAVSLSSCTGKGVNAVKISQLVETQAAYSSRDYHISDSDNLIYVTKSGLIELYFDSVTYGVAIKETGTGKIWYSLPLASDGDDECSASVISVKMSNGENVYYLNSQDNSVAFSSSSFKPTSSGIQITYNMALDEQTAAGTFDEANASGNAYISVTAVYDLSDGVFNATISCGDMSVSDGYTVESIDFLNYFGASAETEEDDFIFVPDNCGAIIKIGTDSEDEYETRTYNIYGSDAAVSGGQDESAASAIIPAFGMKSSSNAFLGIIEAGDTIATVTSHRYSGSGTYNRVGASFGITDVSYSGSEGKRTRYSGESYSGEISICYRFLSGKNASYSGLASACRETLIRSSVLSSDVVSTDEHIPFMLTVRGAVSKSSPTAYTKLSTYEQTQDLLNLLKAKSVDSIDIRYCGILDGANRQVVLSDAKPIGSLGSKSDYEKLTQYVSTQKFELYLDINLITSGKRDSDYTAAGLSGDKISFTNENAFSAFSGKENSVVYAVSMSEVENGTQSFINNMKDYTSDGYCIGDAGKVLYSDYLNETHSRSNAVNILSNQAATLANSHKIMVAGGNFYMLKNADIVVDLPYETYYPETDCYVSVPFVQIILHGLADYSMEPVNLSDDAQTAFLKSVEYGAMPSYEWYCTKTDSDADSTYYYENWLTQAAENYKTADEAIGDLRNARITSHYEVQSGVYCTEYNNSIILYFNYNDEAVTVNSITLEANSCFRVN